MNIRTLILVSVALVSLTACGGGGDLIQAPTVPSPVAPVYQTLASGTYKLTFSAISSARLVAPISSIDVAVKFPAGISIRTVTGGGSGQITPASVTPGNALLGTSLAFGSYSASTRTAYLTMATTQEAYRSGQYINLLFTVIPGASVTLYDILSLNATYPVYKVVGLDTVNHSTVTLTGTVKTTIVVSQ